MRFRGPVLSKSPLQPTRAAQLIGGLCRRARDFRDVCRRVRCQPSAFEPHERTAYPEKPRGSSGAWPPAQDVRPDASLHVYFKEPMLAYNSRENCNAQNSTISRVPLKLHDPSQEDTSAHMILLNSCTDFPLMTKALGSSASENAFPVSMHESGNPQQNLTQTVKSQRLHQTRFRCGCVESHQARAKDTGRPGSLMSNRTIAKIFSAHTCKFLSKKVQR